VWLFKSSHHFRANQFRSRLVSQAANCIAGVAFQVFTPLPCISVQCKAHKPSRVWFFKYSYHYVILQMTPQPAQATIQAKLKKFKGTNRKITACIQSVWSLWQWKIANLKRTALILA